MARQEQPALRAPCGLCLRPWRATDAADVVKAFQDPAIQRWHLLRVTTEEQARQWIELRQRSWSAELGANWAVANDATDSIVGRVGLRRVSLSTGEAELTYWVLPKERGRGIAVHAVNELSRWCLEDLQLHRLTIAHSTANGASCRVAIKASFIYEGTMLSQVKHTDGWHDMHLHARINAKGST